MKRDKQRKSENVRMEFAGDPSELNDVEDSDIMQIRKDVAKLHEETSKQN